MPANAAIKDVDDIRRIVGTQNIVAVVDKNTAPVGPVIPGEESEEARDEQKVSAKKAGEGLQGSQVSFAEVKPWPDAVSGADVLREVSEALSRYVVLPIGAADVLALWCAHAHGFGPALSTSPGFR